MVKKSLFMIVLPACALLLFHFVLHPAPAGIARPLTPAAATGDARPILLVPLDSRPPCTDFVVRGGKIIGREILLPPTESLDYYTQPGNVRAVHAWLAQHAGEASAAVISIDQLLSGGLIAAREARISAEDIAALRDELRGLHAAHPDVPLHAFYILPRAAAQDSIEGWRTRRALLSYARLLGRAGEGLPVDPNEMARLRTEFSPEDLATYLAHFDESAALAAMLIELTEEGTLARLVLGQDDGEPYAVGNLKKKELSALLVQKHIPADRAAIVHGADEIALSMLARLAADELLADGGDMPRVALRYAAPSMKDAVFPFMAVSNDVTAREKIALLGCVQADAPEDADITLFISAGDSAADTLGTRAPAAATVQSLLAAHRKVALVDLSRHFRAEEALLPILIAQDVPVHALAAYAGWNTASNAVGTALSEAVLYHCAAARARTREERSAAAYANLAFLTGRIAEDECYLKESIDRVNAALRGAGYTNTADLDLARNARWANDLLARDLGRRIRSYEETPAFRVPFSSGGLRLRVRKENITAYFPWPRTFEIRLTAAPEIDLLSP